MESCSELGESDAWLHVNFLISQAAFFFLVWPGYHWDDRMKRLHLDDFKDVFF